MTEAGLGFINSCLDGLNIPYQFMEWSSAPVPDTYWVGQYLETESLNEDGLEESTFTLTGTTNQKYSALESVKSLLKGFFPPEGRTQILNNGSGIAISYSDSFPVPSVEEDVHRIQINLNVKEWRC